MNFFFFPIKLQQGMLKRAREEEENSFRPREVVKAKSIYFDEKLGKVQSITKTTRTEQNFAKDCLEITTTHISDETGRPLESTSLPTYIFREYDRVVDTTHLGQQRTTWHRYMSQKVFMREKLPFYSKTTWYNEHGRIETINHQFAALNLVIQIDLDDDEDPVYVGRLNSSMF
jgi:hypothetical protein